MDGDEGARVEVDEADVALQLGVAGVETVALRQQQHPVSCGIKVDDTAAARGRSGDDTTSTYTCPGGTNYNVVFCP
jgi:hypothetical protein